MAEQWKVIHRFSHGVLVQNPITDYQNIGLFLYYEGNKLMRVEHDLDCDDKLEPHRVISLSQQRLGLFWTLLRYRRGVSLPNISSVAQKVGPSNSSPAKSTGFVDVAATVLICSSIVMPDPKVFSDVPARLLVWLRLANDALDSVDPAYAIRNYYMIWEDLYPDWKIQEGPTEAKELKLVRDFVSHAKINNPEVLDFVEKNVGKRIKQYDPADKKQQQFLTSCRGTARKLIEAELDKSL